MNVLRGVVSEGAENTAVQRPVDDAVEASPCCGILALCGAGVCLSLRLSPLVHRHHSFIGL